MISKNESNNEKCHTKEDSHASDQVDEMSYFLSNRGVSSFQTRSQTSNTSHDSVVTNVDNHAFGGSFNSIGGEESQVLGFQGIIMGEFSATSLGLRLSSQGRVVNLEVPGLNDSHISWHSVSKLDLNDVTNGQFVSLDVNLFTVTNCKSILGNQILEGVHDLSGLGLLVVGEDTSDNHDSSQDNTQVQVIIWRLFIGRGLNSVGDKAKNGTNPQEHGKAGKQVFAELDPFRGGRGWCQGIGTVLLIIELGLIGGEALVEVSTEP